MTTYYEWLTVIFLAALAALAIVAPNIQTAMFSSRSDSGAAHEGFSPGVPIVITLLALLLGWELRSSLNVPFGPLFPFAIVLLYMACTYVKPAGLRRGLYLIVALFFTPVSLLLYATVPQALNLLTFLMGVIALVLILSARLLDGYNAFQH